MQFQEASVKTVRWVVAVTAWCLGLLPALAAAESEVLAEVVVSARGTETLVSQTPGGVGVVGREVIFEAQPQSLGDVTARLPGISLSADAAWGGEVVIRGLSRNQVIVLVDDCRLNTATDIGAQFGLINPYDIERIEVLKGPISSLYGSGSLGGVVNVITRDAVFTPQPERHATFVNGLSTNPDSYSTYASASYSDRRSKLFVSAGRRNAQNYEDGDGAEVHNSQFDDWHLTLRGAYRWDDVQTTSLAYRHYEGHEIGIPGQGLALPAAARTVTYPKTGLDLLSLEHAVTPPNGALTESRLMLFWELIDRRVRIEDFPAASPLLRVEPEADHETYGMRWQNLFELGDHTLNAGLDAWSWAYSGSRVQTLRNGRRLTDTPLGDCDQLSAGVFAEDDWQLGETLTLNLGARADRIVAESEAIPGKRPEDTFHDLSWNGHSGLTWRFLPHWSMTLLGATSYRTPDLFDRFKYINLGAGRELYGTPELDPERSLFAEYGLHYTGANVRASTSVFVNRVRDLIAARTVSPTREEMQNVAEARLRGAEADGEWRFAHGWRVYANLAFLEGEDLSADQYLRFLPPLNGLAGLRRDLDCGAWGAIEVRVAARQDQTPPGTPTSDAWTCVDVRLGYGFDWGRSRQDLIVSVANLFDSDYTDYLSTSRAIELKEPGLSTTLAWRVGF
jgi:hemoglobin/transferrin/lactoferrin receptor protein